MHAKRRMSVLAVGFEKNPTAPPNVETFIAESAAEAIATLRLVSCDLLMVGAYRPDLDVWTFVSRVHAGWSHQRWVYVAPSISADDEIRARSLGALMILDKPPNGHLYSELSRTLLAQRSQSVVAAAGANGDIAEAVA